MTREASLRTAYPSLTGDSVLSMMHPWQNPEFKIQNLLQLGRNRLDGDRICSLKVALRICTDVRSQFWAWLRTSQFRHLWLTFISADSGHLTARIEEPFL